MAADDLPTIGLTKYGTFTFNALTETTALRIEPLRDEAGRTTTASRFSITLKTVLEGARVSRNVQAAITELQKQGSKFSYRNRGLGDLDVHVAGGTDLSWGPIPGPIEIVPHGTRAVELTWSVEFTQHADPTAAAAFELMEFNFKLDHKIAKNGDTTRTFQGYLKIPNRRSPVGGRGMIDSADTFRELIDPALAPGFRRADRSFALSYDKSRLDFTITDVQMAPNVPPPGVVLCTASHTYTASDGWAKWSGRLEAEYEMQRGQNVGSAVAAFLDLYRDRREVVLTLAIGVGLPGVTPGAGGRPVIVPKALEVGEPAIYGPDGTNTKVRMAMTYMVCGVGLSAILSQGGLWRPVPSSDWKVWSASVATALGPRGTAGIRVNLNDDAIVDLAGKVAPVAPAPRPV